MPRAVAVMMSLGLVLCALAPVQAAPKPVQTVEGTVILPTPHPQDPAACFAGIDRRVSGIIGEQINGPFGYHFDIDKKTWGGKFILEPTGGPGTPDLCIVFFESFKTDPTDPAGGPYSVSIDTREPGGEVGTVPENVNKAIVALWAGDSTQAAATSFRYEGFAPTKKKTKSR